MLRAPWMGAPAEHAGAPARGLRQRHGTPRWLRDRAERAVGAPAADTLRRRRSRPLSSLEEERPPSGATRSGLPIEVRRPEPRRPGPAGDPDRPGPGGALHPRALGGPELGLPGRLQARPASTTRSTSGRPACWAGGSTSTWTSTPSASTPANNDVQVYYEGLEDEIVRRVDVGTVIFQPPRFALHHRGGSGQQLRRQRRFRGRPAPAPDPRRHPEGERQVAERTYTIGQTTSQAQDRQARDLDFESRPVLLGGGPGQRARLLPRSTSWSSIPRRSPATYRPTEVRLYRYRAASGSSGVNPNLGGITASARRGDGQRAAGAGALGAADPGHRLLPRRLGPVGGARHQAGSERLPRRQLPDRRREPRSAPFPRWTRARLHRRPRAHRRAAAEPGPAHLPPRDAATSTASPARTSTSPRCRSASPSTAPSGRSRARPRPISSSSASRCRTTPTSSTARTGCGPRARDPEAAQVVHDRFIVFPHLEPFADPTQALARRDLGLALPHAGLPAADRRAHGQVRAAAAVQRLAAEATGPRFNLNALQIRDGSEQLYVGGRKLERGRGLHGSPTTSARSPSSTRTRSSGRGAPRSRRDSRSAGSSRWPRRRSSACPPATRWAIGARST